MGTAAVPVVGTPIIVSTGSLDGQVRWLRQAVGARFRAPWPDTGRDLRLAHEDQGVVAATGGVLADAEERRG